MRKKEDETKCSKPHSNSRNKAFNKQTDLIEAENKQLVEEVENSKKKLSEKVKKLE